MHSRWEKGTTRRQMCMFHAVCDIDSFYWRNECRKPSFCYYSRARFLPPLLNSLSFEAFFPSLSSFSHFFRAHFYDFLLLPMLLMLLLCGAFLSELSSNVFFSFFSFTFLGFFDMEKLWYQLFSSLLWRQKWLRKRKGEILRNNVTFLCAIIQCRGWGRSQ